MEQFRINNNRLEEYTGSEPFLAIPDGVRVIGKGAFRDRRELYEITIPASVEEIEDEAFMLCVNLRSVHGAEGVRSLGRDVFLRTPWYKFYSENETDWKDDFLFVGSVLLIARRNLREARIPEGTSMIAADAVHERVLLRRVEIPSSVGYIGWRAFKGCSGLTEITIPGNVKRIGWHAFEGCPRLASVRFGEGVEVLENGVFSSCRSICSVTFPASLKMLGGWMFFSCTALKAVHFTGPLSEIQERTFSGCFELEYVDLPEGLLKIGVEAYYECTNLQRADFPDSVEVIERQAFTNDRYFSELILPKNLTRMEEAIFHGCLGIRKLVIPAFLREVPPKSFYNCRGIKDLTVEDGVEILGDRALGYCTGLTSVELPGSVKEIGEGTFESCSKLVRADRPDGLLKIGAGCFARCTALTELSVPDSVREIGGRAFAQCFKLADEDGNIIRDGCFYSYIGDSTEVTVPKSCTRAASGAFAGEGKYRKLVLPEYVTGLGPGAFCDCDRLEEVRIYSSKIRDLGEEPFRACRRLVTVTACGVRAEAFGEESEKLAAALGFCEKYSRYPADISDTYERYLDENRMKVLRRAVDTQLLDAVKYFTDHSALSAAEYYEILEYAQKRKAMEIVALLLDHRNARDDLDNTSKYDI